MKLSSFKLWFMVLLSLNVFDILTTVPAYEVNPVTLYVWGQVGIFLAAWFKIGLVLFFGILFIVAQKAASPNEWGLRRESLSEPSEDSCSLLCFCSSKYVVIYTI